VRRFNAAIVLHSSLPSCLALFVDVHPVQTVQDKKEEECKTKAALKRMGWKVVE
jgi:hypothetical protein